jgi:hypothetical protein
MAELLAFLGVANPGESSLDANPGESSLDA